jgi:hypothetical protein
MSHKLKIHTWTNGRLHTHIFDFPTLVWARDFLKRNRHEWNIHAVKIYDDLDQLVHSEGSNTIETYA